MSNKKNALRVRIGEKKILEATLKQLQATPTVSLTEKRPNNPPQNNKNKKQRKH